MARRRHRPALTDEDWASLRNEIAEVFTPGAPINEYALFAGRADQIRALQDTALERGRHALIYGERGVGKTSIASIFHKALNSPTRTVRSVHVNASRNDTYATLWLKVLKRIRVSNESEDVYLDEVHHLDSDPDEIVLALTGGFSANDLPVIVIDEFDRLQDENLRSLMTDTIKALSDGGVNCTIVIVGVGESIGELIRDHQSISRSLRQIQMPRMSHDELREIIVERTRRTVLTVSDNCLWRITYFARGLPYFAHLLGKYSCFKAIEKHRLEVGEDVVVQAIEDCMSDIDYSLAESYSKAFERSPKKNNIFREVMAACALTDPDTIGKFTPASVEAPLSAIMEKSYKVPSFSYHLNELCSEVRGNILVKSGEKKNFRFRFNDARMQPFILMKSLQNGIINSSLMEKFAITRQRRLSTDF